MLILCRVSSMVSMKRFEYGSTPRVEAQSSGWSLGKSPKITDHGSRLGWEGTMEPDERRHVPHTEIHHLSRRFLEGAQDILVVALVLVLFGLMVRTLLILLSHLFGPALDFRVVIAEVLFMLVMVELMRLLVVYLEEHRVAVDFMVELGIVATLREVVLRGVVELGWAQVLAISAFLLTLGALLRFGTLRVPFPPRRASLRSSDARGAGSTEPVPVTEPAPVTRTSVGSERVAGR